MARPHSDTDRFGGPGSSHQDREHPGKNHQPTGHKHPHPGSDRHPGEPTNPDRSEVSGGGGEQDKHHTHNPSVKS